MVNNNPNNSLRIIISGGGSGGHIFPAIAIADAIKNIRPEAQFLFVGAQGRMEMEKVPKAGYPIEGLWISGFHRRLTLKNLLFPLKVVVSSFQARRIIKRFQPDVAVGVGGFAGGPLLRAAANAGIPTLIQEQNSYAGVTNRIVGAKVDRVCVAYEGMERFFPKGKLVLTGNPIRQDLLLAPKDRRTLAAHYGLNADKPVIAVIGGSLGARSLNEAVVQQTELLRQHPDVQLLWQCGAAYFEQYKNAAAAQLPNVKLLAFLDRMDIAYALADVVVCRAGAITISELCALGKAAILVPSPYVAEDHQSANAKALVAHQAAMLVNDAEAGTALSQALALLKNDSQRVQMQQQMKILGKPDAADHIAKEVLKLIK